MRSFLVSITMTITACGPGGGADNEGEDPPDTPSFFWGAEALGQVWSTGDDPASRQAIADCVEQTLEVSVVKIRLRQPSAWDDPTNVCVQEECLDLDATARAFQERGWSMMVMFHFAPMLTEEQVGDGYDTYVEQAMSDHIAFVEWFVSRYADQANIRYVEGVNNPAVPWQAAPERLVELNNRIYDLLKPRYSNILFGTPGFEYFRDEPTERGVGLIESFLDPTNDARFDFWAFHGYRMRSGPTEYPPTATPTQNPYAGIPGIVRVGEQLAVNGWQDRPMIDTEHVFMFPWDDLADDESLTTAAAVAVQTLVIKRVATLESGRPALSGIMPFKIRPRCAGVNDDRQGECSWGSLTATSETTPVIDAVGNLWYELAGMEHVERTDGELDSQQVWAERFSTLDDMRELYVVFKPFRTVAGSSLVRDHEVVSHTLSFDRQPRTVQVMSIFGDTVASPPPATTVTLAVENLPHLVKVTYGSGG